MMSDTACPFDPLHIPIDGTNLIEASAGTGKTYGIAALFTRLIVLEKMPVEQVLVVTFTKAATAELKTRLRARLDDVLSVLENVKNAARDNAARDSDGLHAYCAREHGGDAFLYGLLQQALAQEDQARLILRLKAAIGGFDNAAVYTIHGFCQRILRDFAFLCQAPFDVEPAEESRERLLVPAQDFWRERVSSDPVTAKLAFDYRCTPQSVLDEIKDYTGHPYLSFRRPENTLAESRAALQQAWENVQTDLDETEPRFWQAFDTVLSGKYFKRPSYQNLFAELKKAALQGRLPELDSDALNRLDNLHADTLPEKLNKNKTPDNETAARLHRLGVLGQTLRAMQEAEKNALVLLKLDLLAYLERATAAQRKSRRERVYDDLLLDVYRALLPENPNAQALAAAVAQTWPVALIDEFQDTDPLQYRIFSEIFIRRNKPLFLVGDPKQAIYSFRGADIYAYLQAAEHAQRHYSLATNYRSHAKLVNSISALFRRKNRPFVLADIAYGEVAAARESGLLSPMRPAVQVRWLHGEETEPLHKDILHKRAAEYCADEIAFTLNEAAAGRLNVGGRPVHSGDIAVLVRTHGESSLIAKALKARRIQSVLLHKKLVFASPEAQSLASLLEFWLNPHRSEPLLFVLGGSLFRYDAEALYALNNDEAQRSAWAASAALALTQWQRQGIYAAMQAFAARHGIEAGLLSEGLERSLTNYHQLLELLAAEDGQSRSPASLHQWLLAQIALSQNSKPGESNVLRLESDEALVKIVTMHSAKGLQYPLVYCPFIWDAPPNKPASWQILHRSAQRSELLAKHQLDEADRIQLADEESSERLRLLYVALTRAQEQLTVYAAYCSNTADNPFAYLLEGGADAERAAVSAAYNAEGKGAASMAMLKRNWERFILEEAGSSQTDFAFTQEAPIAASAHLQHSASETYRAAVIAPRTFDLIRHTSFTGLSRRVKTPEGGQDELLPGLDAAETAPRPSENLPVPQEDEVSDIHRFPRGTHAGLCLHEILENLDFQRPAAEQADKVADALERYGFEEKWLGALVTLLDCCRQTPLSNVQKLCDIAPHERLPEMGFTLYMEDFNLPALRAWFARPSVGLPHVCVQAAESLDFGDVEGYLNGFIDMTCIDAAGTVYVIDYKSNYLGAGGAAYTPDAMNVAMAEHHYYLQALIYAVAVGRYFKLRGRALPRIAVRYLFLRGIDGTQNGIWTWDITAQDLADWV